jgi:hypothetical protein
MFALFGLAALIALFNIGAYLYGLTLPDDWSVKESVVISAPPEDVVPFVATPRRWTEWSSWSKTFDPTAEFHFDGPESGEGASFAWLGEQLGLGKMAITKVTSNEVEYTLKLQGETFSENGRVAFEPVAGGTRVIWTDGGKVNGTLGRFFRQRLEDSVSADFAASLQRLKQTVEAKPAGNPKSEARNSKQMRRTEIRKRQIAIGFARSGLFRHSSPSKFPRVGFGNTSSLPRRGFIP